MPSWNSEQYLKFGSERTQPALDLVARVALDAPARAIDLGCGPGNSTAVVGRRWPQVELTGLDSSPAMLETAARDFPQWKWIQGDIATWQADEPCDLVFSNAALQWVPEHARAFPHLLAQVAEGGALAVQMPANLDSPPQRMIREVAGSARWQSSFLTPPRDWHVGPAEFYYDALAPIAKKLEMWFTDYQQIVANVDAIVEWYRGTGLRPWLDALADDAARDRFVDEYRERLAPYFPARVDGKVLFPFRRMFLIAYR